MEVWGSYNIRDSVKLVVLLKLLAYIFLIWIWYPNRDMYVFGYELVNLYRHKNSNTVFTRLLAKHELPREFKSRKFRDKLSDYGMDRRRKIITEDISSYSQLKKKGLNDFDLYMKNYKHRYAKKKGFSKLDCYCEKKVFDNIQRLYDIGEKLMNEKKSFTKYILKRYGIGYILIALMPALSFIYLILFGVPGWGPGIFKLCREKNHLGGQTKGHKPLSADECDKVWLYKYRNLIKNFGDYLKVFSIIMTIIVLIVVIYATIKVIKYERLKAGRGKLCAKEYCRFAKNVFI
ncbi:hypothetical protein PVNG_05839 [Plasmodium vivax North Korean]|uniref:Variable surface protein Vir35 n=1 Tax=Plasmodium vivax North Korean TaxID=1035514 RepID=A0A0J9TMX3_PLAVI|nr:hypothetical protein PVNG_05839 [Plasmodium vivax North Korean]